MIGIRGFSVFHAEDKIKIIKAVAFFFSCFSPKLDMMKWPEKETLYTMWTKGAT